MLGPGDQQAHHDPRRRAREPVRGQIRVSVIDETQQRAAVALELEARAEKLERPPRNPSRTFLERIGRNVGSPALHARKSSGFLRDFVARGP
jgi:hypothetical protein